ncbi:hypothetical protein [Campylobacter blaseri]|uniref:Uncharacterized protein n=1 Tax=Campylobacter blaseri TaxID=2042961 RepID=A0A2P8R0I4_9BACT|nr:hypothetical protein [Campylobacter blaseri]PSM51998.1 hypothetical protein CQ405_05390 [Campylobacter blaseri]PSM53783.1 hypothetical protein CRN67_05390 [Campylobacter blaseri]
MASFEGSYIIAFLGVLFGIGSWIVLFPLVIYKSRNIISKRLQKGLSYFSALILIFFAISLLYNTFIKGV